MKCKEKLMKAFEKVDTEKTGKVDLKQFQEILLSTGDSEDKRKMYQNKGLVDALLFAFDENEDGMLTLEELLKFSGEMTDELTIKMLKRCVENANKDKNGFLTATELKGLLMMLQPRDDEKYLEDQINLLIKMCSHDGSKKVKPDEVVQYLINLDEIKKDPKEKAKVIFRMFDTNSDGYIDVREFYVYIYHVAGMEEEAKERDRGMENLMKIVIAEFDKDGDEKLNFEEFEKFLEESDSMEAFDL